MKNKIGLVLSHFFVRKDEEYKYDWIEKSIINYQKLSKDFHIVLCGHGEAPNDRIKSLVDKIIWLDEIDEKQLGTGHPHFCIKGFEYCLEKGIKLTLKNRAYDYLTKDKIFNYNLVISEQTDLNQHMIGDLLMFGETEYLLNWWKKLPWDYSKDGLRNLYKNLENLEEFKNKVSFFSPEELGWKTLEYNTDVFWGLHKGFNWYGGF